MMASVDPLVAAHDVVKGYRTAAGYVPVLAGVDLHVAPREMVAIVGASGVGKSTLLHVLGSLDRPESGRVVVAGQDVFALDEDHLREFRNRTLGFVFQFHHLLPEFTALENVMMPMLIARRPLAEAREKARALLEDLGTGPPRGAPPGAMSGGEQQRVAVARALVQSPAPCSATSPAGTSTRRRGRDSTPSSVVSIRRKGSRLSSSPTTSGWPPPATACCASKAGACTTFSP